MDCKILVSFERLVPLFCICVAATLNAAQPSSNSADTLNDVCKPLGVTFDSSKVPAQELVTAFQKYRDAWKPICSNQKPPLPSLATAYEASAAIPQSIADATSTIEGERFSGPQGQESASWTSLKLWILKEPARVLPGVKCREGFDEVPTCDVPMEVFATISRIGSIEDSMFFSSLQSLRGTDEYGKPWQEPKVTEMAVFRGCTRFGSYDWIGSLQTILKLKTSLQSAAYRKEIEVIEEALMRSLEVSEWSEPSGQKRINPICTCGDPSKVLPDLQRIYDFVSNQPMLEVHADAIKGTIDRVKRKEVPIQNISQNCGGG